MPSTAEARADSKILSAVDHRFRSHKKLSDSSPEAAIPEESMSLRVIVGLILLPSALFFVSLFLGRYFIDPVTVLKIIGLKLLHLPIEQTWTDAMEAVVVRIRFPRAVMAVLVGAGLSISGASFQGMFHNPLVSPYLLGVSSGAGFGAALAIMFNGSTALIQCLSFSGGLLAVILAYSLSRIYRISSMLMLVLSGIVVSAFFQALISLMKYTADTDDKLPAIVFWLMGSLGHARLDNIILTVIPMLAGIIGLVLVRWRINILSMGDREAKAMGVNTEFLKAYIIVCTTIVSAAAVSICGIVGWVGLVIPHVCRMIVGPDHRKLLPATLSVGAAYLLLIDNLSRLVIASEIPLGILTAVVGAPFFAYLLRKSKGGWA